MVGLGSAGHTCLIGLLIRLAYHTCSNGVCTTQFQNKSHYWSCVFESKHAPGSTSNIKMWRDAINFNKKIFFEMPSTDISTIYFLFGFLWGVGKKLLKKQICIFIWKQFKSKLYWYKLYVCKLSKHSPHAEFPIRLVDNSYIDITLLSDSWFG